MARIMPSISDEFIEFPPEPFRPYVFGLTSRRNPTSVSMAATAGGDMKIIDVPPGATVADLPQIQEIARAQYLEDDGQYMLFGAITGFLFNFSPTDGILLDVDGNEVGRRMGKFWSENIGIQDGLTLNPTLSGVNLGRAAAIADTGVTVDRADMTGKLSVVAAPCVQQHHCIIQSERDRADGVA